MRLGSFQPSQETLPLSTTDIINTFHNLQRGIVNCNRQFISIFITFIFAEFMGSVSTQEALEDFGVVI